MKVAVVTSFLCLMASSVSAFAPNAAFSRGISTQLFSEPEEEEGLDLNLEEMFDMFDAADKEESFDDAIKKVKSEE